MMEDVAITQRIWDYLISLPGHIKIAVIVVFIIACIVMGIFTIRAERRKSRTKRANGLERKYIRIQEIGLAVFLSWPVAMWLAFRYELDGIIPAMSVVMIMTAMIIFFIGLVGKQELKEHGGHRP